METRQTEVYWVLGLPVDLVTLRLATAHLRLAAAAGERLVFATPNLNFLRACRADAQFREHVLRCDLSLADGMPVLWLARLLGVPLEERVAGSTLVETLLEPPLEGQLPLRTFLFGAQGNAAEQARRMLNRRPGGLVGVGALNPGAGDLAALSKPEIIEAINQADADLLIIALGAAKGHAWIEHNRAQLNTRLMSHLGAVVNFLAGTVKRAPAGFQKAGLEWFWRMLQETRLFSRYAGDGVFMLRELLFAVLPLRLRRERTDSARLEIQREQSDGACVMVLRGGLTVATVPALHAALEETLSGAFSGTGAAVAQQEIVLDFDELQTVDSRGLGYLYALRYRGLFTGHISYRGGNPRLTQCIRLHRAGPIFEDRPGG